MTATLPDGRHESISGERRLWAAVILRAIQDALWRDDDPCGSPRQLVWFFSDSMRRKYATRIRDEAIFWLTIPNHSFSDRCLMAGLDPDVVRTKARKLLDAAKTPEDAKAISESLSVQRL